MADLNKVLASFARSLNAVAFFCSAAVVLISPWCFGAWEMWWFWPFAGLIFVAALLAGGSWLIESAFISRDAKSEVRARPNVMPILVWLGSAALPLLAYIAWRGSHAAPSLPLVTMENERGMLLFYTPVLLAVTLFMTASRRRIKGLATAFFINGVVLSVYALINHWLTNSDYIMWIITPFNYGNRVTGSFFCPNHTAAFLNILLCFVLAVLATFGVGWRLRTVAALAAVPLLLSWFLTLSRGGVGSLLLCLPVFLVVGLRGFPWRRRLLVIATCAIVGVSVVWGIFSIPNPLTRRLEKHPFTQTLLKVPQTGWEPMREVFFYKFDRGMYIGSALRAWRSNPTIGIGPGQHAIRWPQFAPTEDGDRENFKYPRLTNHTYYLYEVHSDWTQLLEEYGVVGFSLFVIFAVAVIAALLRAQGKMLRVSREGLWQSPDSAIERSLPLAALLAIAALAIHSLGDFSLQIPAITWSLAALIAMGLLTPAVLSTNRGSRYEED